MSVKVESVEVESQRRPGGPGAGLTRERIVGAAIELMNVDGAEGFSVRELGRHLGVKSSALYWHFPTKDDLCREAARAIWRDIATARPSRGSPRERLEQHLWELRERWLGIPSAVELMRLFPPMLDEPGRVGRELLEEFGVPATSSLEQYRALVWVVLGFVQVELGVRRSPHHRAVPGDERRYEVLADEGSELRQTPVASDRLFRDTLELVLDGLALRLSREPGTSH